MVVGRMKLIINLNKEHVTFDPKLELSLVVKLLGKGGIV